MKRFMFVSLFMIMFAMIMFTGCFPAMIEPVETIETYQTGFLVPLEGDTKNQAQFMSVAYLDSAKVAAKRVTIPIRKRKKGRGWGNYEILPTMRLITVDRTPVTREWTNDTNTGTSNKKQAIDVESKESIGFSVGANITAFVEEVNTAQFLYLFPGKDLAQIMDSNVKGFVTSVASREFGKRTLEEARNSKDVISDVILTETKEHFAKMGITISNIGIVGGLQYDEPEIQKAINENFTAEMNIIKQKNEMEAQRNINKKDIEIAQKEIEIAKAQRMAAEEFAKAIEARTAQVRLEIETMNAQARLNMSEKWGGNMPANILPEGSSLLMGLDTNK